jgi:hypothetical protein
LDFNNNKFFIVLRSLGNNFYIKKSPFCPRFDFLTFGFYFVFLIMAQFDFFVISKITFLFSAFAIYISFFLLLYLFIKRFAKMATSLLFKNYLVIFTADTVLFNDVNNGTFDQLKIKETYFYLNKFGSKFKKKKRSIFRGSFF